MDFGLGDVSVATINFNTVCSEGRSILLSRSNCEWCPLGSHNNRCVLATTLILYGRCLEADGNKRH